MRRYLDTRLNLSPGTYNGAVSSYGGSWQTQIAAYIAASGTAAPSTGVELWGYEGGPETCVLSIPPAAAGSPNATGLDRDVQYDPVFHVAFWDLLAAFQAAGFAGLNLYTYGFSANYNYIWSAFLTYAQPCGKGDGSDGKANNRLVRMTPGLNGPLDYTKASTTNQDANSVSVRGQAFVDWMTAVSGGGATTPTQAALVGANFRCARHAIHGVHGRADQPDSSQAVTVTLASTVSYDTFQSTVGGANVTSITIAEGATTGSFYVTSEATSGNRSISITTSPALTYPGSPITYSASSPLPTTATLAGPTSGTEGVQSTAFTVSSGPPGADRRRGVITGQHV